VELTLLFPAVCFWRNGIRTLSEFDPEPLLLDLSDALSLLSLQRRHFILFSLSFLLLFSSVVFPPFHLSDAIDVNLGRRQQLALAALFFLAIDSTTEEIDFFLSITGRC
jgi:hypothetical protein